jgi:hypothetical protein
MSGTAFKILTAVSGLGFIIEVLDAFFNYFKR